MCSRVDIVPGTEVGDLQRLQGLAEDVFGRGDRPQGWFARKLRRECVDPALTRVAVLSGRDPTDTEAHVGYMLVGAPPSLGGVARSAGTGVRTDVRGQGIGKRLLEAVTSGAASAGLGGVRILADPNATGFYRRHGFDEICRQVTMLCFGRNRGTGGRVADPPSPWTPAHVVIGTTHLELCSFLAEAWERTEPELRTTFRVPMLAGNMFLHVSHEGRARLVQRILWPHARASQSAPDDACISAIDQLRERFDRTTPCLITGLEANHPAVPRLERRGWTVVQHCTVMSSATDRAPTSSPARPRHHPGARIGKRCS